MDLSIIIVSYNVKEKLRANLERLFQSKSSFSFEVIVVDNNSQDASVLMLQDSFSNCTIISNSENLGFAKANNLAIQQAKGKYLLLLNPDMLVFDNTIELAMKFAIENQKAIVSSCKLVDENDKIIQHVRKFPSLQDQLAIVLKIPHLFPSVLNSYIIKNFDYSLTQEVDSVRGSFFMINREAYCSLSKKDDVSLDERYFIWFEEVDFCKEVKSLGGQIWYNADAKCLDYVGSSFSQLKTGLTQKYFRNSMIQYFKKWHQVWQYYILKLAWILSSVIVLIASPFNKK